MFRENRNTKNRICLVLKESIRNIHNYIEMQIIWQVVLSGG